MSFEFDNRGGFRFPQIDERERNDRFREDIGFNPIGRIIAPILQSIFPGAQDALYPPVYPQDQYSQGNYQQTADQIATSMRMGDAQQAANLLQNELNTNPGEAPSVIALAQQETQSNSRDRLVTGQDGSLQIQDTYTGQSTFAGWLPNNAAGNYGNDGNQWQYQNGDQNYWTGNGTNNLQPYLNPGYNTDYGYANNGYNGYNGYNNYNQFNPAQTALDLTLGSIGGLALGSLFNNSGNYGYRPGYSQQQWQPTQQYTGQNTAQQYQPTQTYTPTTSHGRQHSSINTAQQYQPTQTYTPTNTAQQYQPTQTYTPTNTSHVGRPTNTAQQYQPSQSYTAAINTAQQYHPNPYSSTTTAAQQYHPTMQYKPTINTAQTQPVHQWTPGAVNHPATVGRPATVAEVSHPAPVARPATPPPSPHVVVARPAPPAPHAVVAAKPAPNQPKHA